MFKRTKKWAESPEMDAQEMWRAVNRSIEYLFLDDLGLDELGVISRREAEDLATSVADEISARFLVRWRSDWPMDRR